MGKTEVVKLYSTFMLIVSSLHFLNLGRKEKVAQRYDCHCSELHIVICCRPTSNQTESAGQDDFFPNPLKFCLYMIYVKKFVDIIYFSPFRNCKYYCL